MAIIGAGAAGCFAAANIAAQKDVSVTIFEKTGKALQKVKASGGGRCNVTHACFDVPELVNRYPRGKQLLRKSLHVFNPEQTINWFQQRGVKLKAEEDGRMFPITDSSQTIIDCIWQEMMKQRVEVQYHKSVERIEKLESGFRLHFVDQSSFDADKILVATGGFPKPEQYEWLRALGHTIQSPVPSLFTFNMPKHPITELMGLSVPDAIVKIMGTKLTERGPLLITHWGMSGPAILRTSAWAARELHDRNYDFQILINWLGDISDNDLKEQIVNLRKESGKQFVAHKNPFSLPKRLWEYQLQQCGITDEMRWGDLPAAAQNKLIERLLRDPYAVKGKTTFKEEFVTCGGVNLSEVNAQTMESRVVPGLYFAGEILDVDGITGGFNFQHAWSSATIAASNIADV
ncbi:aminoacetone oxidase family FAD-binding enzyme [Taibaiella soli]|uniref:Aminoacetone oxidase family FAD-binding enzyme n=1 Tax=Taibaiella soli TaxID=1649169 RepID=A0A2W2BLM9_9BACT|nr:aminoacetone oxidase family FAD-binding enzyme [Taibaiella soli]